MNVETLGKKKYDNWWLTSADSLHHLKRLLPPSITYSLTAQNELLPPIVSPKPIIERKSNCSKRCWWSFKCIGQTLSFSCRHTNTTQHTLAHCHKTKKCTVYVYNKQVHLGPALQFQRPLWQKWWEVWLRWGSSARRLPVSHSGSSQWWSTLGRHDHTWEHSVSLGCFRAAWEIPTELVHSPVLLVLIKSQVLKAGLWWWWMVNWTQNPRPTKDQKSNSQNCKLI